MTQSPTAAEAPSVSETYSASLNLFNLLSLNLRAQGCRVVYLEQVDLHEVSSEYGRLKIWGEQTKAYLPARARGSLDDVLRNDEALSGVVREILSRVNALLGAAIPVVQRKLDSSRDSDQDSVSSVSADSDSEADEEDELEPHRVPKIRLLLQQTYQQIHSLYDLSSILRRPSVAGKWIRSVAKLKTGSRQGQPLLSAYRGLDLCHVSEKVRQWRGLTKEANPVSIDEEITTSEERSLSNDGITDVNWLCERLADANVRRREQLQYWSRYPYMPALDNKDELSQTAAPMAPPASISGRYGIKSDISTIHPSSRPATQINNRSAVSQQTFTTAAVSDIHDAVTDSRPRTLYAPTIASKGQFNRIPNAPKAVDGVASCPYCGMILDADEVGNRQRWKRHVFRDLRPYVCTFKECQSPAKLYVTRNDWKFHELQMHRRKFFCTECNATSTDKNGMVEHLMSHPAISISQAQLPILLDLCNRQVEENELSSCQFCGEIMSLLNLQVHIVAHMEEIAIFVLPTAAEEGDQSDSCASVRAGSGRSLNEGSNNSAGSSLVFSDKGPNPHPYAIEGIEVIIPKEETPDGVVTGPELAPESPASYLTDKHTYDIVEALSAEDDGQPAAPLSDDQSLPAEPTEDNPEIIEAARDGFEDRTRELLLNGAEIEANDIDFDRTALSWASERGHAPIVQLLLEQGANIHARDIGDQTPLSLAARNGHKETVRLLVGAGADIEARDNDFGQTPLSWACERGYEGVAQFLLERGANAECAESSFGQAPLSLAAENGHVGVLKLLLNHGANMEAQDRGGRTALSWGARNGHEDVVKYLRSVMRKSRKR